MESTKAHQSSPWTTYGAGVTMCPTRKRLALRFSHLESIETFRNLLEDPAFAEAAEARIIGCELLELELQFIDEQIERITTARLERQD